ncbi:murein hydrolase activator [Candidatus Photodesmus blepharus]|uniref:Murein hydrolase activator n=1 Tax=Candidatus Photodesmus blepharonis TaxID=1179155 RepID=A0A084CMS1_9GAMM|nr:peptidoglycan DD-metalloendopeptidase family protein [Candidatus Photodesmus blepharus]KEY91100.1 murein hydrolase activator [Candidatus Photodesmus blepharus]
MGIFYKNLLTICIFSTLLGCAISQFTSDWELNEGYDQGSYRGSYYEVEKGDTLYFISYITGKDVKEIIRYNNLKVPYIIYPGQKLRLWKFSYVFNKSRTDDVSPVYIVRKLDNDRRQNSKLIEKEPINKVEQLKSKEYVEPGDKLSTTKKVSHANLQNNDAVKWLWPTSGKIIKDFSSGNQGNKGIDIAGERGQIVLSAAEGVVVYSGNALRGYGNLIIIKHNDDYISAYAHNESLLVGERENVVAGQKIATMGSSEVGNVHLHFEIRYKGKSVNPRRYLP